LAWPARRSVGPCAWPNMHALLLASVGVGLRSPSTASATIARGDVHHEPGFCAPEFVSLLRSEIGRTAPLVEAESFSSNGERDGLRSALTCRPSMDASSSFVRLYDQLDAVRTQLSHSLGMALSPGMEATFVVYPPGGYYRRHIDSLAGTDPAGSGRRVISFLVYLSEPFRPWTPGDGGALACYRGEDDGDESDVCWPESGLLVAFDSKRVWHEVRPTRRERACVVGWLRAA